MTSTLNWSEVMERVPRERFIPDLIWRHERGHPGNDLLPVDRRTDPETWAAIVTADGPVTTQVDNGHPDEDGTGRDVTSSCSDRRVVAGMLQALNPRPVDRVLEIGTGTGWNAAILAEHGALVTSIEIDEAVAERARGLLGDSVEVITGDGTHGWAPGAPYDSIIATVGAASVPPAWVEQTKPGGRLVVPLTNEWQPPGIAVLERTERGAVGRLAGPAAFMALRGQAVSRARTEDNTPATVETTTKLHPYYLVGDRGAATAIGQRVTGITWAWREKEGGGYLWMYTASSWACLDTTVGPPYEVEQAGPRCLFDEVAEAYRWWRDAGEPGVEAWLVTADQDGQRLELDG